MSVDTLAAQTVAILLAVVSAPALLGWVNQCRAWLQQRRGAGVLQPYHVIRKLFHKDAVVATNASGIFRAMPYLHFGAMASAAAMIPARTSSSSSSGRSSGRRSCS